MSVISPLILLHSACLYQINHLEFDTNRYCFVAVRFEYLMSLTVILLLISIQNLNMTETLYAVEIRRTTGSGALPMT